MKAILATLLFAGCVTSTSTLCDDGVVCPEGSTCTPIQGVTHCVNPDQVTACDGKDEGVACELGGQPAACHSGVCLPARCGNALLDPGEQCDDGNTTSLDGCSADCTSSETCRNGVVDAALGEQCDDGNANGHDGCGDCAEEVPTWTDIPSERPAQRSRYAMAYDSQRRRVVAFGGEEFFSGGLTALDDDTHEWDGLHWVALHPAIHPGARNFHQMAYDGGHGYTVLFSGSIGIADTWLWDGTTWTLAAPTTVPETRLKGSMVYDSKRKRVIMFGGGVSQFFSPDVQYQETWTWTGTDWMNVQPATSPPKRQDAAMAYDPKRDRIVLYGGRTLATMYTDLWEFDGSTWKQVMFTGAGPGARTGSSMAFDPVSGHVILIGGNSGLQDVWDWDGSTWSLRAQPVAPVANEGATTDTTRGRVVLASSPGLRELVGATWVQPPTSVQSFDDPIVRYHSATALDPARHHVIVFGGLFSGTVQSDTFVWDGAWTQVTSAGPTARYSTGAAFDRAHQQMVMFGGCSNALCSTVLAETRTFDTVWHPSVVSTVPARSSPAMAYDDAHHQVVMFGGKTAANTALGDTWLWDGQTWTQVTPAHPPLATYGAAMGYDEAHHQIVMFSGHGDSIAYSEDTWIWDGDMRDWIKQAPISIPERRVFAGMAWDHDRHRLVLYGGTDDAFAGAIADAWEWDGTDWRLVPTQHGPAREGAGVVSDVDGGILVIGGGYNGAVSSSDPVRLRWDGVAHYETCTNVDVDGDGLAGCADSDCEAACVGCGDGTCDPVNESCGSCPADCGACAPVCGDGVCGASESCLADC